MFHTGQLTCDLDVRSNRLGLGRINVMYISLKTGMRLPEISSRLGNVIFHTARIIVQVRCDALQMYNNNMQVGVRNL